MDDQSTKPARLSDKQRLFLDFYLGEARFNATKAARLAGYSDPEVSGYDNKQNPVIRARIEERLKARALSADEVLAELTDVAASDWGDFLDVKMDLGRKVVAKMDLSSKVKALELLGKAHALFTDKVQAQQQILVREYADGD